MGIKERTAREDRCILHLGKYRNDDYVRPY